MAISKTMLQLRSGPNKVHERTHLHLIIFAKQSKLVGTMHAYTLVIESDPNTNGKVGFVQKKMVR